jgi:hypothetical protein
MTDPNNDLAVGAIRAVPESIWKDAYTDGAKGIVQEAGKIGTNFAKTVHLCLFPIQYTAVWQDRLAAHLKRAIEKVPEDRRVEPPQHMLSEILERLKHHEVGDLVSEMYTSLLARALDGERSGEAHPAFVSLIAQLAPDEVSIIDRLSKSKTCIFIAEEASSPRVPLTSSAAKLLLEAGEIDSEIKAWFLGNCLNLNGYIYPGNIITYLHHLQSLGVAEYAYAPEPLAAAPQYLDGHGYWHVRLSAFGELFHAACVRQER